MKIELFEDYKGMFFFVCDEPTTETGDEYVDFFTTYEEALRYADSTWYNMCDADKKGRRMYVAVSNTEVYLDCDQLASSDDEFIESPQADIKECVNRYKMDSEQTKLYQKANKEYQERLLKEKKELHKKAMKVRDDAMKKLADSSDLEKCRAWMEDGFPQPSGNTILRIKKELGLSWREFESFLKNL